MGVLTIASISLTTDLDVEEKDEKEVGSVSTGFVTVLSTTQWKQCFNVN